MAAVENFKYVNWIKSINQLVQICLCISFIIGLNYFANNLYWRSDLTRDHIYSLSPESLAYIRQIDKPIKIIVTLSPAAIEGEMQQVFKHVRNLLKEYEYAGNIGGKKKIEIEVVDVLKERKRAEYLARTYGIDQQDVVLVVCEDRQHRLIYSDIIEMKNGQMSAFKGERAFTSALIDVSNTDQQKVYFISGYGEMHLDSVDPLRGLSNIAEKLKWGNILLETLNITRAGEIPEDADLLILASPQGPYRPQDVEKLRNYLTETAGKLIVLIEPAIEHGLSDLFYEWGIISDDMVVLDMGEDFQAASGDLLIRRFAGHPITDILRDNPIPVIAGLSRPVRRNLDRPVDDRLIITPLISSSPDSWAERSYRDNQDLKYNPEVDLKGQVSLAVISEKRVPSSLGIDVKGGRLVVFGNTDIISNHRIRSIGNIMLILNTINWCLDREQLLAIQPRPVEEFHLLLSRQELTQLSLVLLSLPGAVAICGIMIYWIRKN